MDERYFDYAATAPLCKEAREAMDAYERAGRGNPFRGVHAYAERATVAYDAARKQVASCFGASQEECVFTKSATEGLNLLANGLEHVLAKGDEILLSAAEHHANLLPWRRIAERTGCALRFIPLTQEGGLNKDAATRLCTQKTKILAVTHVSNVLGSVFPIQELADIAHASGAYVIVDGAQAVGHLAVDFSSLGVDAYVASAHKMYGPMGIGMLLIKKQMQEIVEPLLLGGGMVEEVGEVGDFVAAEGVRKYEAGTPNVTGAVGYAAACAMLAQTQMQRSAQESVCIKHLLAGLSSLKNTTLYGKRDAQGRIGVFAISIEGKHPHDVAQMLADEGFSVRAGLHCAAPLARCLHKDGVVRISIGKDLTKQACDDVLACLERIASI